MQNDINFRAKCSSIFNRLILLIIVFFIIENVNSQSRLLDHQFDSKFLRENRIVNVYLPKDYFSNKDNYPVLYLLDGEYIFDFAKGSVDFLSNEFGFMPKLIIVSIPNTDRIRDLNVTFNSTDGYINFLSFLELELLPFINSKYRTNNFNTLYGWSTASSICTYLLATNSKMFKAYIETGSGIGKKTAEFIKNEIQNQDYLNTFLYANTEDNSGREKHLWVYKSVLDSIKPHGINYMFSIENDSHVGAMSKGLYEGLKFIFNGYYIPEIEIKKGKESIIAYYKSLENIYGFKVKIPLGAFIECSSILYQDKPLEAISLLEYGLTIYPVSSELYGTLAEIYEYRNQYDKAKIQYNNAFLYAESNSIAKRKYSVLMNKFKEN
ncbi:MAG: hypothetical protein HWD85_04210 [Flavobacteriaceae bacterium]|nr:hypothetical protein [Flavobacteriaceae bacterium]